MPAVYPTTIIELGLGGSTRQTLIDDNWTQWCLPLSELSTLSRAEDVGQAGRHGTYNGSGLVRGVRFSVAENSLGVTMNGNQFIESADDGQIQGMSLDGGDGDVGPVLVKDLVNDATNRCIIGKQTTNSTGNGYHLSIQSLMIEFYLKVAGVEIFNFQRGPLSVGQQYWIHGCYETGPGTAKIFANGSQLGATVTSVTTEPGVTAAPLRVGAFTNGSAGDGNGFKGSIAYASISREGNPTLTSELYTSSLWTDVSRDVHGSVQIHMRRGIAGTSILDNVAQPGTITFALNNSERNSGYKLGFYSPGHPNCRTNFGRGIPVRWSVTYNGITYRLFRGKVTNVAAVPGAYGQRITYVTAAGWLDFAASISLGAVQIQTTIRSDEHIKLTLDQTRGRCPAAVDISAGSSVYVSAFDIGRGDEDTVLSELARGANSERGFIYERGDTVEGGTFRSEGRADRQQATTLDATFSNTMHGLEVSYDEQFANIVRIIIRPRSVAAAVSVLYDFDISRQAQQLQPNETRVFEGDYRLATNDAQEVGGTEMVTPVSGTDYAFFQNSDGTGANYTSSLGVVSRLGGSSFRLEIRNNGSNPGYLRVDGDTGFQIRGKAITYENPVTVESRADDSVRKHGPRTVTIDMQYESDVGRAKAIADFYLSILSQQPPVPTKVTLRANQSHFLMTQALSRDIGDKIGIVETVTGLTTDDPTSDNKMGYFINEVDHVYEKGHLLTTTWTLSPSTPATGVWVWDEAVLDETTRFGL